MRVAREKHRSAHVAHDAHVFPVEKCFRDVWRANRKVVGIVGNVGNSTHLHIVALATVDDRARTNASKPFGNLWHRVRRAVR
jgi:hypothetical protein